jgi:hypothetical protein
MPTEIKVYDRETIVNVVRNGLDRTLAHASLLGAYFGFF